MPDTAVISYEALVEDARDLIWQCDAEGRYVYLNRAWEEVFGYRREEMLGRRFCEFQAPRDGAVCDLGTFMQMVAEGALRGYETVQVDRSGRERFLCFSAVPISDADGRLCGARGTAYDLTGRKQIETALERSEEQYHRLFDELTSAYAQLLPVRDASGQVADFRIAAANPAFARGVGRDFDALSNRSIFSVLPGIEIHWLDSLVDVATTGHSRRLEGYSADLDGWFDVNIFAFHDGCIGVLCHDISEMRRTQADLLQKSAEIEAYFSSSLDLWCVADIGTAILRQVNPQWQKILGYSHVELIGCSYLDFVHPDDLDATVAVGRVLGSQQQVMDFTNRYRAKDGSYRWLEWRAQAEKSQIYAAARDITERRRSEEELRRQEEELQRAEKVGRVGGYSCDFDRDEWRGSGLFAEVFGCTDGGTFSRADWLARLHPDDVGELDDCFEHCLAERITSWQREYRIQRPDGTIAWIFDCAEICYGHDGKALSICGTITDITRRRLVEIELLEQQNLQEIIVEQAPVGIAIYRQDGSCRLANQAAAALVGCSREEMLSLNFHKLGTWKDGGIYEAALTALSIGEPRQTEAQMTTTFGRTIWKRSVFNRIYLDGEPHLLKISEDIGERKRAEEEFLRARAAAEAANRAKSEFLANMSHEIRTPMSGVLGMLELLRQTQLDTEQKHYLETIDRSAVNLLGLINDILDLARIEAGKLSIETAPFAVSQVLDEVVAGQMPALRSKGLDLDIQIADDCPLILGGDALRFRQIVLNLLGNAVKFTQTGGIRISLQKLSQDVGRVVLQLSIADSGIGMSAETMARIFEPFEQADTSTTRRFGGTGLGLAICRRLTDLLGGTISVESRPGAGSRFTLTLPFQSVDCREFAAVTAPSGRQAGLPPMTILLGDDNPLNLDLYRAILQRGGHALTEATTGVELVEARKRGTYDVMLVDIQMPLLDGIAALQQIRIFESECGADTIPAIAVTAHALKGDEERLLAAGFDGYLAKPFSVVRLEETLSRIASSRNMAIS